jgi:hypothetical protein
LPQVVGAPSSGLVRQICRGYDEIRLDPGGTVDQIGLPRNEGLKRAKSSWLVENISQVSREGPLIAPAGGTDYS